MKTRQSFVSNSSSSSFLLKLNVADLKSQDVFLDLFNLKRTYKDINDKVVNEGTIARVLYKIIKDKNPATKKEIIDYFKTQLQLIGLSSYNFLNGDDSFISMLISNWWDSKSKYDVEASYYLLLKYIAEYNYIKKTIDRNNVGYDLSNVHHFVNTKNSPIPKLINEMSSALYVNLQKLSKNHANTQYAATYLLDIGIGGGRDLDSNIGGIIRDKYDELFERFPYLQYTNS